MGKHLCKFKVGDYIAANEESNGHYSITNKRQGYVGYVTEVLDITEEEFEFGAADIVVGEREGEGDFQVWSPCFDLVVSETVVPPDDDLFERLF